ncbi:hypothetical protein C8R42DRAFT_19 [Lentinula raphanica]|nr:hypothetical protein C8R42DRAFT_19 [Lentinula raphanica]
MMLILITFLLILFSIIFYTQSLRKQHRYPLPPGPKKLPIVDNLFNMPRRGVLWLEYAALCRQYSEYPMFMHLHDNEHHHHRTESDIVQLSALGTSLVIMLFETGQK